jgi:SAM-dependent methyltransferase
MTPPEVSCPACGHGDSGPSYVGPCRYGDFEYQYRVCHGCRSLFADPMPGEDLLRQLYAPEYLDRHYARDLHEEASIPELGRELERTAADIARRKPGGRLLDIGCGAGRFMAAASRAGLTVEGFEPNAATAQLVAESSGFPVHTGTLDAIAGSFDVVHVADVLEHMPRPLELLQRLPALLSPQGILLARGPLEQQPHLFQEAVRLSRSVRRRLTEVPAVEMPPGHVVQFTLRGWHALFDRAGLQRDEERVYEVYWPVPEKFAPRPSWSIKWLSRAVSHSMLGREAKLGNRVVSVARR